MRRFLILLALLAAASAILAESPRGIEKKSTLPPCSEAMAPGTPCAWVPFSALAFNVPNVNGDTVDKCQVRVLLPHGFRAIELRVRVSVAPNGETCSTEPSETYEGQGGLSVDCQEVPR